MEDKPELKYCPNCKRASHHRAPLCSDCGFSYHLHLEPETDAPPPKLDEIAADDRENEAPSPAIRGIPDVRDVRRR